MVKKRELSSIWGPTEQPTGSRGDAGERAACRGDPALRSTQRRYQGQSTTRPGHCAIRQCFGHPVTKPRYIAKPSCVRRNGLSLPMTFTYRSAPA